MADKTKRVSADTEKELMEKVAAMTGLNIIEFNETSFRSKCHTFHIEKGWAEIEPTDGANSPVLKRIRFVDIPLA